MSEDSEKLIIEGEGEGVFEKNEDTGRFERDEIDEDGNVSHSDIINVVDDDGFHKEIRTRID